MSSASDRARLVQEARDRILAAAPQPFDDIAEVVRRSTRAHQKQVTGDRSVDPSEVLVRFHGKGVHGHLLAMDYAGQLLSDLQKTITWIGSRIRKDLDQTAIASGKRLTHRSGIKESTRLYLQPQLSAGSLVFHLVAAQVDDQEAQALPVSGELETMLDQSMKRLMSIIGSAQDDSGGDLGELTSAIQQLGPRVASSLDRLADNVVKHEINVDLTWSHAVGARQAAKLGRRGALAIQDAVTRNRVRSSTIDLVGLLETVSVGKDPIRIETGDGVVYKMSVAPDLGARLGVLLHQRVAARATETVTWHVSGKETKRYVLLAAEREDMLGTHDI